MPSNSQLVSPVLRHSPNVTGSVAAATSVIIADDHEVVRVGLRWMLEKLGGLEVIGEASDGRTAVRLAQEQDADLLILDAMLPLLSGIEATRQIMADNPDARVIICSSESDRLLVEEAFRAGARGFLLKSSASLDLAVAVRAVTRGEVYLSPKAAELVVDRYIRQAPTGPAVLISLSRREREVLRLLSEGNTNKQIAERLGISVRTVEAHRLQVMEKLNMRSVAELTKYAIRQGITTLED